MNRHALLAAALIIGSAVTGASQEQAPDSVSPISRSDQRVLIGRVIAYDWSTRYYMEGARVDRFIFSGTQPDNVDEPPSFVRVVLVWHPADRARVLPPNFYGPQRRWKLITSATTPFDFVRDYCASGGSATFSANIGECGKVNLNRYVDPSVLSPDVDLATNLKKAIEQQPTAPDMPDIGSIPCVYLQAVTAESE